MTPIRIILRARFQENAMRSYGIGAVLVFVGGFFVTEALAGEDEIRQAFSALQKAIKTRDPEKIWALIDGDSQSDANRAAKAIQAAFSKAADKADYEKKYGLTAKELSDMTGKLFLKSNRFHGKYYEVPDSKFEAVKVKGNTAKMTYIEEDGDREKFALVKQKGLWKFVVPMPKAVD
jgi:hypothetical protein